MGLEGGSKGSILVKTIGGLFDQGEVSSTIFEEGIIVVVGRGNKAKLWSDVKVGNTNLKVVFLRVFALAQNKNGCVRDYGRWENSQWIWDVSLRRPMFDWELEQ